MEGNLTDWLRVRVTSEMRAEVDRMYDRERIKHPHRCVRWSDILREIIEDGLAARRDRGGEK